MFTSKPARSNTELTLMPTEEHDMIQRIEAAIADIHVDAENRRDAYTYVELPTHYPDGEKWGECTTLQFTENLYLDGLHVFRPRGLLRKRLVQVDLYRIPDEELQSYYEELVLSRQFASR